MQQNSKIPSWLVPASFLFYLILNVISWRFPFFWDTLLTSTICSGFYENGFSGGIPPTAIDAGHPPLFYGYILLWWKVLGKNLMVSHLAMLPFLWIMVYQFINLADRLLMSSWQIIAVTILFVLETTIIAQSTMVSYDIVILCFYLFGLRYVLDNKNWQVLFAGLVLSLISLRGVVAFGALFVTELVLFKKDRKIKNIIPKYLPALIIFGFWNLWHFKQSGWMLFATSDHWAGQRGLATINGMIKNVAVIIRNLLEPGRILLYFLIFTGLISKWKKVDSSRLKIILTILFVPSVIFSLFFIPFNNPIGHRYLMIVFALSIFLFALLASEMKFKNLSLGLVALAFVSGHFWYQFYPSSISKGWDSSLEHLPYFEARNNMWEYIDANSVSLEDIHADFPLDVSMHQSNLGADVRKPQKINDTSPKYLLVSNINNDFETTTLDSIKLNYTLLKKVKSRNIEIELYQNLLNID